MSQVYCMKNDGTTQMLQRIACLNEDQELQSLIAKNLEILPGAQMNPEEKLRWLLIKREMPVPSPASGESVWSLDFLLVDQFGYPTLVECKRKNDPRSRREVIGQMMEYAANGRHYWNASEMLGHAQAAAGGEARLAEDLAILTESHSADPSKFFSSVEQNLRQSKMRLIFFLEDSPLELRSMVEFLNSQMTDTEVLIVEARQYEHANARIVVPHLFGYTEQARVAKRASRAEITKLSHGKGETAFRDRLNSSSLTGEVRSGIYSFIEQVSSIPGCTTVWQKSFLVTYPSLIPKSILLGVRQDGYIELYLSAWKRHDGKALSSLQREARDVVSERLKSLGVLTQQELEGKQCPQKAASVWLPKSTDLMALMRELADMAVHQDVVASSLCDYQGQLDA